MKVNIQKERSFYKKERDKFKKRKELQSQNKTLKKEETSSRLTSLNSDIEKLYKKYAEIKKERLLKEKSQQILVNRLKYLRNEAKRSISKKDKQEKKYGEGGDEEKNKKIFVKVNSKYKYNKIDKRKKGLDKQSGIEIFNDNDSISKISFNGNESEIIASSYKSLNTKKINSNTNNRNSSSNLNSEKENIQNENNCEINKNKINNKHNDYNNNGNIEEFLKNYKYNIGNKNSNNNIYIIINNPTNNNNCNEKRLKNNLENNNKYDYDNCTPKDNNNNFRKNNFLEKCNNNYRSNNIIDLGEEGDNIILMNANGRRLQDIINSINNLNYINKKNNNDSDNRKENIKNEIEKTSEPANVNEKEIEKEPEKNNNENEKNENGEIDKKDEKNDGFVRPSFLNLYKNEENSGIKQKIDDFYSNRDTNRFDNTLLQTTESKISNNKEISDNNKNKNIIEEIKKNNINNAFNKNIFHQHKTINSDNHLITENIINKKNNINKLNIYLRQKKVDELKNNEAISFDNNNLEFYKLYNSVNNTNNKIKNLLISSEEKDKIKDNLNSINVERNKKINNNKENIYQINKQKKLLHNKNNIPNNFVRIDNKQINYSLSQKNLNSDKYTISNKENNYNTKWNINLEKIRKNNFRKDSYCTTIEKKRKALGLEFKLNFGRELSIQTEKNTEKKNKILGRIRNNDLKNKNLYKNNLFYKDKLIKVRKKDEYKKVEKRFKFLKRSIENEKTNHRMMKNKTSTNFNYNKSVFKNDNKKELRNRKINDNPSIFNNNDNISNKTTDSCVNYLIKKDINEN